MKTKTIGRITPSNRRETAEAWALGITGALLAVTKLSGEISKEKVAKLIQGVEVYRGQHLAQDVGTLAVNTSASIGPIGEISRETLATVIRLHPAVVHAPPEEQPLEAA